MGMHAHNLVVSWVDTHIKQLAQMSCDPVRVDVVKCGDEVQCVVELNYIYYART